MEQTPRKYQQALLTVMGLIFLFLVIMLNHYHPRNQGVADITHGSIYKFGLSIGQQPQINTSKNGTLYSSIAISLPASSSTGSSQVKPIGSSTDNKTLPTSHPANCTKPNVDVPVGVHKGIDSVSNHQNPASTSC